MNDNNAEDILGLIIVSVIMLIPLLRGGSSRAGVAASSENHTGRSIRDHDSTVVVFLVSLALLSEFASGMSRISKNHKGRLLANMAVSSLRGRYNGL